MPVPAGHGYPHARGHTRYPQAEEEQICSWVRSSERRVATGQATARGQRRHARLLEAHALRGLPAWALRGLPVWPKELVLIR